MSGTAGYLSVARLRRAVALALDEQPAAPEGDGVAVVGATGGAGETCLAAALSATGTPAWPAGHRWPSGPGPVLVACRSTAAGLWATQLLLGGHPGDPHLLGVAVVADAPGRMPYELAGAADAITEVVPAVWHIGFAHDWRWCLPDRITVGKAIGTQLGPIAAAAAAYPASTDNERNAS